MNALAGIWLKPHRSYPVDQKKGPKTSFWPNVVRLPQSTRRAAPPPGAAKEMRCVELCISITAMGHCAPTPLEADVPYSGLRKGGLLHKHSRQHATKTQCWSSCKDPPFPTPPACPPASTSATSTASTTCLPHPPPTLLPTPRPARLLSYSLPAYTTRRGGPVPGGLPLPRPALLLRSPTTDIATLIDAPFDYRKRRRVP